MSIKRHLHPNSLLVRSEEGTQQMRGRAADLPPKLRAVLFLIDGQSTVSQLLDRAGSLGELLEHQIHELLSRGLVIARQPELADGESTDATLPTARHKLHKAQDLPPLVAAKMQLLQRLENLGSDDADVLGAELLDAKNLMELATNAKMVSIALEASLGAESAQRWWGEAKEILVAWRDIASRSEL